ncbi:glycoside hydrolase family 28 protein [Frateuria aurantia]
MSVTRRIRARAWMFVGLLSMGLSCSALGAPALCQRLAAGTAPEDATSWLQQAIDRCSQAGGGRLELSAGVFRSGPLALRSGVDLHLDADAVLQGIAGQSHYRAAYMNWPFHPGEALLGMAGVHDVRISGDGRIDGDGQQWWPQAQQARLTGEKQTLAMGIPASNGLPRPWLIEIYRSDHVRVDGVHIVNAPMWNLVTRYSHDVDVQGVSILNPPDSPNTDGIDVVASRRVRIRDSRISTGDDCIAIKSGLPGSTLPREPTVDVRIEHLWLGRGHGLSVGSETLFGIRQVDVHDVVFDGTDAGVRIKSGRDRGSQISDIHFSHLRMRHVGTALSVLAYYPRPAPENDPAQPVTATTPRISHISVDDVEATDSRVAGLLVGLPEAPLQDVRLDHLSIQAGTGLLVRHAQVALRQVRLRVASAPAVIAQRGARLSDGPDHGAG